MAGAEFLSDNKAPIIEIAENLIHFKIRKEYLDNKVILLIYPIIFVQFHLFVKEKSRFWIKRVVLKNLEKINTLFGFQFSKTS